MSWVINCHSGLVHFPCEYASVSNSGLLAVDVMLGFFLKDDLWMKKRESAEWAGCDKNKCHEIARECLLDLGRKS